MSNSFDDFLRLTRQMRATIAPMNAWRNSFPTAAFDLLHKNQFPSAAMSTFVADMFKQQSFLAMDAAMKQHRQKNSFKSVIELASFTESLNRIAKNQYSLISMLTPPSSWSTPLPKPQVNAFDFAPFLNNDALASSKRIHSLQSALLGVSKQIALKGLRAANADFLDKFQATTDEALVITQEISETPFATSENIAKLEAFIGSTLEKFREDISDQIAAKNKSPMVLVSLWITILSTLITLFSILQTCQVQSETAQTNASPAATKEDLKKLKQFVSTQFEEAVKLTTRQAKLNRACNLKYKPSAKSSGFYRLQAGQVVSILDTRHKWVYVTVVDRTDSLPVMGWIQRKYLVR